MVSSHAHILECEKQDKVEALSQILSSNQISIWSIKIGYAFHKAMGMDRRMAPLNPQLAKMKRLHPIFQQPHIATVSE